MVANMARVRVWRAHSENVSFNRLPIDIMIRILSGEFFFFVYIRGKKGVIEFELIRIFLI